MFFSLVLEPLHMRVGESRHRGSVTYLILRSAVIIVVKLRLLEFGRERGKIALASVSFLLI